MKDIVKSENVDEAFSRAMAQLDAAKLGDLAQDAAQDAMNSLDLSKQELERLAQSMKDGKSLEEALRNLQMAKQLAAAGKLGGADGQDGMSAGDFSKLFAEQMAKLKGDDGSGKGGPGPGGGVGSGAKRPPDNLTTNGRPERSPTMLGKGRMLLEWKTSEVGVTGNRAAEYREAVRGVKQGVSEALQAEQVPPGYHEAIKKYFDTLPETK